MKTLKFKSHLVEQILDGSKTVTWRLFDDKDLKKGDIFRVINSDTGEDAGKALIEEVKVKPLGQVNGTDFNGHEKYKNQADMFEHYKKYYGDKMDLGTMVKMVKFKLLK